MNEVTKLGGPVPSAVETLDAFSRGEIGREHAMHRLGVSYGELLDRLASQQRPLPQLPRAEVERMAARMVELLDSAGG